MRPVIYLPSLPWGRGPFRFERVRLPEFPPPLRFPSPPQIGRRRKLIRR